MDALDAVRQGRRERLLQRALPSLFIVPVVGGADYRLGAIGSGEMPTGRVQRISAWIAIPGRLPMFYLFFGKVG